MFLPIGDQPNPRGVPVVNYALIAANALVFLFISLPLMGSAVDPQDPATLAYLQDLLSRFPDVDPRLLAGEVLSSQTAYDVFVWKWGYRPAEPSLVSLFTSMFLHGGWLHLIGNMLFLWIYGDNVEERMGRLGYLLGYVGGGLAAALIYGAFMSGSGEGQVPMVGASGAISGALGFYFVWFPRNRVRVLVILFPFYFGTVLIPARIVLGIYLVIDNLLPFFFAGGGGGGVAYGAHIGGFVAGVGGAVALNRLSKRTLGGQTRSARVGGAQERASGDPMGEPPGAFRRSRFDGTPESRGVGDHEGPWASHAAASRAATNRAAGNRAGESRAGESRAGESRAGASRVGGAADGVVEAFLAGQPFTAYQRYLDLIPFDRARVPVLVVVELADWLAADARHEDALSVYRAALEDHPNGPGLDRVFLGIGLVLLHGKGRPTAAYQYLLNALEENPSPEVERAARAALAEIAGF